jgi:aarF domain-containing kinase
MKHILFVLINCLNLLKVCAYKDGEVIIDTAAGVLGKYDPRPVKPDSLFPVFSVTKGITAGMVHWLVDNGYVVKCYEN